MLANSNLSGLHISDIVHNLSTQKATVTRITPVLSAHLLEAFLKQVQQFEPGSPERGWDIVFHGTPPENIPSIVSEGFKLPDQRGHSSRFRSNWGPGLYCSPFGTYSYSYGYKWKNGLGYPESRPVDADNDAPVFVCSVVRGKPFHCQREKLRTYETLERGFDSHVSSCENEYIVFNRYRLLPLCLLWIRKDIEQLYFQNHKPLAAGTGTSADREVIVQTAIKAGKNHEGMSPKVQKKGNGRKKEQEAERTMKLLAEIGFRT